jgi:hypothetical protein
MAKRMSRANTIKDAAPLMGSGGLFRTVAIISTTKLLEKDAKA